MNFFKKLFSDLMADDSNDDSSFVLSETTPDEKNNSNDSSNETKPQNVYPNLSVNLEYINSRFNSLINSDIKIREFLLHARNKQYHAFIIYIDGMSNSDSINDFILSPLMLRNRANPLMVIRLFLRLLPKIYLLEKLRKLMLVIISWIVFFPKMM